MLYVNGILERLKNLDLRPRLPFIAITLLQFIVGLVVFALGLSAFTTTPQFPIGSFWAGLLAIVSSIYRTIVLIIRLYTAKKPATFEQHKLKLSTIMVGINAFVLIASICGVITESLGSLLLQQTKFEQCSYSDTAITAPCDNLACTNKQFPPNTCYCCYIMEGIKNDCDVTLLTGRQYYFSGVSSCMDVQDLRVLLILLVMLHVLNAIISTFGICKTSPIIKLMLNEKDRFKGLLSQIKRARLGTTRDSNNDARTKDNAEQEVLIANHQEERAEEMNNIIMTSNSDSSVL